MVVDRRLEVEHRPTAVVGGLLAGMWRVDHAEGDPITQCGVFVFDIGFDPQHHLAGAVLAVDHRLKLVGNRVGRFVAVRRGLALAFQCRELLGRQVAGVRLAHLDQLAGVLVVGLDAIRRSQHLVGLEAKIGNIVENRVVRGEIRALRLGVGVVEPDDELAVVPVAVGADDRRHAGVAEMPWPIWIGCGPQADRLVVVDVRQLRQRVLVALVFSVKFVDEVRIEFGKSLTASLAVTLADLADDTSNDARHFVAVRSKVRVLAHQRPHDRTHIGIAVVFERVEQGVFFGFPFDALAEFLVH